MKMEWLSPAVSVRVIDGDSVVFDIDCGYDIWMRKTSVRLFGIDTSETRGGTTELKALGVLAKEFVADRLGVGTEVLLRTHLDRGKFGRVLADIYLPNGSGDDFQDTRLNEMLLDECLAVQYFGQSKEDIVNQHLIHVEHWKAKGRI